MHLEIYCCQQTRLCAVCKACHQEQRCCHGNMMAVFGPASGLAKLRLCNLGIKPCREQVLSPSCAVLCATDGCKSVQSSSTSALRSRGWVAVHHQLLDDEMSQLHGDSRGALQLQKERAARASVVFECLLSTSSCFVRSASCTVAAWQALSRVAPKAPESTWQLIQACPWHIVALKHRELYVSQLGA